jgi:hypothetical protein
MSPHTKNHSEPKLAEITPLRREQDTELVPTLAQGTEPVEDAPAVARQLKH